MSRPGVQSADVQRVALRNLRTRADDWLQDGGAAKRQSQTIQRGGRKQMQDKRDETQRTIA